jgi:hypothetical protein
MTMPRSHGDFKRTTKYSAPGSALIPDSSYVHIRSTYYTIRSTYVRTGCISSRRQLVPSSRLYLYGVRIRIRKLIGTESDIVESAPISNIWADRYQKSSIRSGRKGAHPTRLPPIEASSHSVILHPNPPLSPVTSTTTEGRDIVLFLTRLSAK